MESDLSFFRRRAAEEQAAALQSPCDEAKRAHGIMAERYQDLVRALEASEDKLGLGRTDDPLASPCEVH